MGGGIICSSENAIRHNGRKQEAQSAKYPIAHTVRKNNNAISGYNHDKLDANDFYCAFINEKAIETLAHAAIEHQSKSRRDKQADARTRKPFQIITNRHSRNHCYVVECFCYQIHFRPAFGKRQIFHGKHYCPQHHRQNAKPHHVCHDQKISRIQKRQYNRQ